jgi:hypothetical protein
VFNSKAPSKIFPENVADRGARGGINGKQELEVFVNLSQNTLYAY